MILHMLVNYFFVCTITTTLCLNEDIILKSQKPGKTNIPIINRRAVFLVIGHCLLLIKVFSVCILILNSLWFCFFTWCFPWRFNFFFKDLTSAICLLPTKQPERNEPEGCSPPASLKIIKRKRQKGERS